MLPAPPPFVVAAAHIRNVRPACPDTPNAAPAAALPARCPALDVVGHLDPGALSVDPAFDTLAPSGQLLRADPGGNVTLTALGVDGAPLFSVPFLARDSFHVEVPVSPVLASQIRRIRIATSAGATERLATAHGEPVAEVIAAGDRDIVIAWDALAFPSIRVTTDGNSSATLIRGESTYQQTTFATAERYVTIDFSDGVRSVSRRYRIFGR